MDRVRWIRGSEALEADILAALTRPTVTGRFWVDLDAARLWIEDEARRATAGREPLTYTHLFVKAAALAAMASPALHRMHGPLRCVDPGAADVAVSVAGVGALAPVVVLAQADRKPLLEIARELRELARKARDEEPWVRSTIDRFLWVFPFPFLRRLVVRLLFLSPGFRRRAVGTIQVSNVGQVAPLIDAYVPVVGEVLLVCGAIERRVVADEEDRVAVRTGAQFVLHASHRKLNAVTAAEFISRFRSALASPAELG